MPNNSNEPNNINNIINNRDTVEINKLFTLLQKRVSSKVYRKIKNKHEAEEIIQQVLYKCWRQLYSHPQQFSSVKDILGYTITSANNACKNHFRDSENHAKKLNGLKMKNERIPEMEEPEIVKRLVYQEIFKTLPKLHRTVLSLWFEGYKKKEIAKIIGKSTKMVTLIFNDIINNFKENPPGIID